MAREDARGRGNGVWKGTGWDGMGWALTISFLSLFKGFQMGSSEWTLEWEWEYEHGNTDRNLQSMEILSKNWAWLAYR